METKVIFRYPLGNPKRKYRQDRLIISTFNANMSNLRRGLEHCRELGFNTVEFAWVKPDDSLRCITACEEVGIDGIFQNWDVYGGFQETRGGAPIDGEKLAAYVGFTRKFRHFAGYYVWDEPLSTEKIRDAASQVAAIENADPGRLPFTVAIPSYNRSKTWKNGLFEGYLREYTETISPAVLSLDFYPFWNKKEVTPEAQLDGSELFLDIGLLRELSLEHGIPMWFYFQTQDDPGKYIYRKLTPAQVRVQQYNALMYGAVGLQNYNVYNGALTSDGSRGPLFFSTKELNSRSYQLGKTLTALRSEAVFHSPELLRGRAEFDRFRRPLSDSGILADGELPFRISAGEFSDSEGNRYLFVLNRDYELAAGFGLALKKNFRVYEVSKEDGMQRVLNDGTDMLRLSLQPGDAVLLRFQDAAEQPFLIDYVLKK